MFLKTCMRIVRALLFVDHCMVCRQEGSLLHPTCVVAFSPAPRHSISWIHSQWHYSDPAVRRLIYQIKQKPSAEILETCCANSTLPFSVDEIVLVPIPASPERIKKYGFNQARLIADALAQRYPEHTVCDVLIHTSRDIPKQALIKNRNQRLSNKHGTYSLPPEYREQLCGKHIVIIDDVSTTGATLIEAHRVLANAGPASIQAWTLGH